MIKVTDLTKIYKLKDKTIIAINGFSVTINKGEISVVLGPNGSGKTTFVKILCDLVKPTNGNVLLNGISSKYYNYKKMAVVLEGSRNINWRLTPYENMELYCASRGLKRPYYLEQIKKYINLLELNEYAKMECRYLSRGNQQKVALASSLAINPEIMLLDEPTIGLDVEINRKVMNVLKAERDTNNLTVLITTHDMEFVESIADKVIIIRKGKLHNISTPKEILENFGSSDSTKFSDAYLNLVSKV